MSGLTHARRRSTPGTSQLIDATASPTVETPLVTAAVLLPTCVTAGGWGAGARLTSGDLAAEHRDRIATARDRVAEARTAIDLATSAQDRGQAEIDRAHAGRDRDAAAGTG